ncbi:MAG: PDZ domain-containing protein [Gaiellaceae bacterium]
MTVKRVSIGAIVVGALGIAVAAGLWALPADEFIFVPDRAKPLAERVTVEEARPTDDGAIYYVDVFVRRLTTLERVLPFTKPEGSAVVPEELLLPTGTTQAERNRQNREEMDRSEQVAALVALRELGYDVTAIPRGALVTGVFSDTPAAGQLATGDVVVAVDGKAVRTPQELQAAIATRKPGEQVRLTVRHAGKPRDLTLGTIANPNDSTRPFVGITVDQAADIELPIDVDIDLGRVGGPSAGLPFALEITRLLGEDITGGCRVAATGELALDGSVIRVGGIPQKTVGARRADVDAFLVPAGENAQEARRYANGLRVIPVESFQQALRALETADLKC